MYFAYGWPRTLGVKPGNDHEDIVYLCLRDEYLVLVSTRCIQLWSGGQHRVRLGVLRRDLQSVQTDGLNRRAVWCSSRRLLGVLVSHEYKCGALHHALRHGTSVHDLGARNTRGHKQQVLAIAPR